MIIIRCGNCKWHCAYECVCTNGESEYVADFTDSTDECDKFELDKKQFPFYKEE